MIVSDHRFQEKELTGNKLEMATGTGLPNPNFRKQEFFLKNQDLIRRFFSKNQEKNQEIFP
jgi:hypothetical protein